MSKIIALDTELTFSENELIVSRTDTAGRIQYCNQVFIKISGYNEKELLGRPHNIIRHPHMPRCIYKMMWDRISSGKEIFAYVRNLCKGGQYYWVFAHITPTFNGNGQIIGYHSNRRKPKKEAIAVIKQIYEQLLIEERKHSNRKESIDCSTRLLMDILSKEGKSYDEFILSI
ncbi:PAS domain-containing protein [Candidatus Odyssella thessalonicensis]|uniref:PAS domain-containing protein n=1 Tax=Candidatus Odyssella thessalonicensis TaxID=84647 RepID=UPI000225A8A6|nr:PAS domain-containing protein [Candidatus Odyssella thessalonicensis]